MKPQNVILGFEKFRQKLVHFLKDNLLPVNIRARVSLSVSVCLSGCVTVP